MSNCDCLNNCGDDPDLATGKSRGCRTYRQTKAEQLPEAIGMAANSKVISITFKTPLTHAQLGALRRKVGLPK